MTGMMDAGMDGMPQECNAMMAECMAHHSTECDMQMTRDELRRDDGALSNGHCRGQKRPSLIQGPSDSVPGHFGEFWPSLWRRLPFAILPREQNHM
jgi:hypothetical protein